MKTTILVDGNGLVCRLWWANPAGVPERFTNAILAVKPDPSCPVVVAWDADRSWRRELWPAYKSHRPPKPKALLEDLAICRHLAHRTEEEMKAGLEPALNIRVDGFEADDVIATETKRAIEAGEFVVIVSDDKDMAQLVGRRCLWYAGGKIYDENGVIAKFGVPPTRIRHLLSWTGDKVDGLAGVPGYGMKKAAAKALAGEIGNQTTYDLTELEIIPDRPEVRVGA